MNRQHLEAFLWLRWRLLVNQMRRGGVANTVVLALVAVVVVLLAAFLFAGSFLLGLFGLREVPPWGLLLVWDGLVGVFLFSWAVGLLNELQRSEALSLEKFLHLPVSATGAFLVNYLSSLASVTLILFLAAALGLGLGLVFSRGPALLVLFPLLAAFILAVTAVTYQFQGWLASLMTNPRRRRTILVLLTAAFVLSCQLPNLVNIAQPWKKWETDDSATLREEQAALQRSLAGGKITPEQYRQQVEDLQRQHATRSEETKRRTLGRLEHGAWLANLVLPPGWLPLGVAASAEDNIGPALLGSLGLALIGAASLWRAYRTTLRLYTGQFTSGTPRPLPPSPAPEDTREKAGKPSDGLLGRRLPWVSEPASAIALGGFVTLLRAPEAKMMMLTPLIMVVIFGSLLFGRSAEIPLLVRPLLVSAGMAMVLISTLQVAGNQFGFDRAGFRVLVLTPAPRREVLLGKNLAFAPLPLVWGVIILVVLQCLYPMRLDHLLATIPQMLSMFLLFSLLANLLSILAPMPIAAGSFKPTNVRLLPVLLHLVFMFLFPVALAPTFLPLGVDFALEQLGLDTAIPIGLLLSVAIGAAVVFFYRLSLGWQGQLLQAREREILNVVTTRE